MTDSQTEFDRDGYVVVRGLISPDECDRLTACVEQVQRSTDPRLARAVQRQYGRRRSLRIVKLNQLTELVPEFEELAHRTEIVDRVEQLIGPESRVFRDVTVVKPAHTGGVLRHHQDSAYWDVEPKNLVSAWIALSDAPVEAGPLSVIPGSHRSLTRHDLVLANRVPVPSRVTSLLRRLVSRAGTGDNVASAGGRGLLWRAKRLVLASSTKLVPGLAGLQDYHVRRIDPAACCVLDVARGDVVFFHSLLVHGTGPNTTTNERVGAIISYMPSGSTLPRADASAFPLARRTSHA
jgi:ectoine hydroxylase-related dioxygenase (phytanoyl-CoA dioxygenase family)